MSATRHPAAITTLLLAFSSSACSGCRAPASGHGASEPGAAGAAGEDDDALPGDQGHDDEGDEPWSPASTRSPTMLAEVDRELAAMRSTTYSHHVVVDEAAGRFQYDCSGFAGYAAHAVRADALAPIPRGDRRRPQAAHFEEFFAHLDEAGVALADGGRWQRVASVDAIEPGDVIAWKKPASSKSKNTGHVVIAHGLPRRDPRHADTLLLDIVDSTGILHGASDRRARGTTGLGQGTIGLVVDGAGRPVGYRWTPRGAVKETAIAIGRLR